MENSVRLPDGAEVRAALDRVLASAPFVRSPQLARFLRFIVSERLSGRNDPPKEYALGLHVFDIMHLAGGRSQKTNCHMHGCPCRQ